MMFIATFTSDTHVNACDVVWGEEISRQRDVLVGGVLFKVYCYDQFSPFSREFTKGCSNLLIASRLVPCQKKGELHNYPKQTGAGDGKYFSLCLSAAHVMGFIIPGCSLVDCTTTTMSST